MRVLHICQEYGDIILGGAGTALTGLARTRAEMGFDTAVMVATRMSRPIRHDGWLTLKQTARDVIDDSFAEMVEAFEPDVLHMHEQSFGSLCRQSGLPVVFSAHGWPRSWAADNLEVVAMHLSQQTVVPSLSFFNAVLEHWPALRDRTHAIGHGIHARKREQRTYRADSPLIMFCGRFAPIKGINEALAVIPAVLRALPNATFVFVGDTHGQKTELTAWRASLSAEYLDHVTFTGWISHAETQAWMDRADLLMIPSRKESFGMTALEGMLAGIPIVATNVEGLADLLEHEVNALIVPARDTEALCNGLLRLAREPSLAHQLAERAHEKALRYTWPNIVKQFNAVYEYARNGSTTNEPGGKP